MPGARKAYWFKVWLSDPVKHGDSYTGYTLYRVATKTDAPDYALDADAFVLRRFSDFEWLHLALRTKLPGEWPRKGRGAFCRRLGRGSYPNKGGMTRPPSTALYALFSERVSGPVQRGPAAGS